MSTPRLFVIGLDAADKDMIDDWAAKGLLPNFRNLLNTALQGDIENPRGLEAGAVWPTFYFGLLPGDSGQFDGARLFDYTIYDHVSYRPETDLNPPIWTTLSKAGKLCGVIDAPYNYPVNSINGMKIVDRGAHVPAGSGDFMELRTHPPELVREIEQLFGTDPAKGRSSDYFPLGTAKEVNIFRNIYCKRIVNKTDLTLHYWRQQPWDFFMSCYTEAHCAGHRCWHIHDPNHPDHDPELARAVGDPVKDIYIELDRAVGRILEAVRDKARVVVYLSHGMGPRHTGTRMLDRILARLDNQNVTTNTGTAMNLARAVWRHIPEAVRKPLMPIRNNLAHDSFQPNREGRRFFEVFANDRTAGIRINLAGREAKGMVQPGEEYDSVCEQLIADLKELRNAESGEPLIREILHTRDHYSGRYLDRLPDLLVTWNRSAPINVAVSAKIGTVDAKGIAIRRTGDHRTVGRFFAVAPEWTHRRLDGKVKAQDFAPTFARLLGVPPAPSDGNPITALLDTAPPSAARTSTAARPMREKELAYIVEEQA